MKPKVLFKIITYSLIITLSFGFFSVSASADGSTYDTMWDVDGFSDAILSDDGTEYPGDVYIRGDVDIYTPVNGFYRMGYDTESLEIDGCAAVFHLFYEDFLSDIKIGDEYNLKFAFKPYHNNYIGSFLVDSEIKILNSDGTLFKKIVVYSNEQTRDNSTAPRFENVFVDTNFVITSDMLPEGGYSIKLCITLSRYFAEEQPIWATLYDFYYSEKLVCQNLDDNSGILNSIIDWLKGLYYNIAGGGPDNVQSLWQRIVSGVSASLNSLGDSIGNFFDSLKDWILYFKSPVTTDENGVPVDGSGTPVYINPFESALESVKAKFFEWISTIVNAISSVNAYRDNVVSYIAPVTEVIDGIFTTIPAFAFLAGFACVMAFVRKIVGR